MWGRNLLLSKGNCAEALGQQRQALGRMGGGPEWSSRVRRCRERPPGGQCRDKELGLALGPGSYGQLLGRVGLDLSGCCWSWGAGCVRGQGS